MVWKDAAELKGGRGRWNQWDWLRQDDRVRGRADRLDESSVQDEEDKAQVWRPDWRELKDDGECMGRKRSADESDEGEDGVGVDVGAGGVDVAVGDGEDDEWDSEGSA